jgi:hypothetical protein
MKPFSNGELHIDVLALTVTQFRLDWRGRSASRNPGTDLQPWLRSVLTEARNAHASIELRFQALEYFNSSTVAVLVDFVRAASAEKVPLQFIYSADVRWQRLSFDALQVFSRLDHNITVSAAPRV